MPSLAADHREAWDVIAAADVRVSRDSMGDDIKSAPPTASPILPPLVNLTQMTLPTMRQRWEYALADEQPLFGTRAERECIGQLVTNRLVA